ALVIFIIALTVFGFGKEPFSGPTILVKKEKLLLTIVERGTLESAQNKEIMCEVKAGSKNTTVATTIKWVIDDGTSVKKDQLLVELDDSGLQEQLKQQEINVLSAVSAYIQADEGYQIQLSQNYSDI